MQLDKEDLAKTDKVQEREDKPLSWGGAMETDGFKGITLQRERHA